MPQEVRNATHLSFERPNIPYRLQVFLNTHKIARYCYSLFINKLRKKCRNTEENINKKWHRDIGLYETGSIISVKKATLSVHLRYLHYKITNRIITTNKFLHIINISESNACTFCKHDVETIVHLFWQCPVTQNFLKHIDRELHDKYNIHFQHCKQSWFFLKNEDTLQTLLITIAKSVIYKARNAGEKPRLSHMITLIKIEAQKEQLSSRLNDTMDNFQKKWKALRNILL